MSSKKQLMTDDYTVGIIYVKPIEMSAITTMMDESHQVLPTQRGDDNEYTLGRIGEHNVVIVGPARGAQGKAAIADVVGRIRLAFKNIQFRLLVGIGGGVPHLPENDVRLGDVVVGAPESGPAVIQYDLGKQTKDDVEVSRMLNKPPPALLNIVNRVEDEYQRAEEGEDSFFAMHLQRFAKYPRMRERYKRPSSADQFFRAKDEFEDSTQCTPSDQSFCEVSRPHRDPDDVRVHYSTILSGDLVMKSAEKRDFLSRKFSNALCFEMEAAGVMDTFSCLVVRGICDYSDSHKNKDWQGYAAATAAAYARQILLSMAKRVVEEPSSQSASEGLGTPRETQSITFSGDNNSGFQLGNNTGTISGFSFGGKP